jgi:hypothetical protein
VKIKERIEKYLDESLRMDGKQFTPKPILFSKFAKIVGRGRFEGLVFLGAGGNHDEWVRGITGLLKDEGVSSSKNPKDAFMGAYRLETTGGRIDLALVFNSKKDVLNIGKLAMWRLRFGECSWISDYVVNYADHH